MNINIIYEELKKLVNKALEENEVPISSIIVEDNNIIGRGYNRVESTQNFMNHAEVLAIKDAMKYKNNWRLDNCILYTTLEPCSMCNEIIKKSRIKKVVYFSKQTTTEHNNSKIDYVYNYEEYFSSILTNFFMNKRKKNNVSRETLL